MTGFRGAGGLGAGFLRALLPCGRSAEVSLTHSDSTNAHWAVILAAGMGTRMASARSKVLHPVLGRPMVAWPVATAREVGLQVVLVVHHQEEAVRSALAGLPVHFARQETPRGTGDAVAASLSALPESGTVVVLNGDGPLLRASTLQALLATHEASGNLLTVVTMTIPDPAHYGRIVRDARGLPVEIVEAANASPAQLAIPEVNTGLYAMDIAWLRAVVPTLVPHPPKGEVYLTDCVALAAAEGRAGAMALADANEALGVNSHVERAVAVRILQDRLVTEHMLAGVAFEDPASVTVEPEVRLAPDVWVERGAVLRGRTNVGRDATIGAYSVLIDSEIGAGASVQPHSVLEGARVGIQASVGPFARLRAGSVLGNHAKVGNFVETKKATLGAGAKVSHLSYIGDAAVGEGANVGAGTITCNYDGFAKHHTHIGAGAFIGSNTALVAPVRVGAGALVGAGSVIVSDVPADAIATTRVEQRNREGAAARFRSTRRKPSA